jgi:hypothetical protein
MKKILTGDNNAEHFAAKQFDIKYGIDQNAAYNEELKELDKKKENKDPDEWTITESEEDSEGSVLETKTDMTKAMIERSIAK